MNYIGIDPSLTSTAITVYNGKFHFFSYLKNYEKPNKWTKKVDDFINIKPIFYDKDKNYSKQENLKLNNYIDLVKKIINDIKSVLIPGDVYVSIEGYSFGSSAGHLIDLVTLGTLIRKEVKNKLNCELIIYSPSTLKKETCGLVYGWKKSGVRKIKYSTRNKLGISGGNFKKHQMLRAIYDLNLKESQLNKFCKEFFDDLYSLKKIPSPIDDIIDSYWVLKVLLNDKIYKEFKIINE